MLEASQTSWTGRQALEPGTYYVHVSGLDRDCFFAGACPVREWSAIVAFTYDPAQDPVPSATSQSGLTACSDGVDNDGDGLIDLADGGCDDDPARLSEVPNRIPRARATPAKGTAGKILRLRYQAWDIDGPRTRERVRVFKRGRIVATSRTRLHRSTKARVRVAGWRPRKRLRGRFVFCVVGWDAEGARSRSACAPIKVRPPKPPAPPAQPLATAGGSGGSAPPASGSGCHPSYAGACLLASASDYDCVGGGGDGPFFTGPVRVIGPDVFGLDRDGDGIGCE